MRRRGGLHFRGLAPLNAPQNVDARSLPPRQVRRGHTDRDEYEKESRRIRYATYAETLADTGGVAVLVAHHQGQSGD